MNYGVPYRGSKNAIAKWVISHLPAGDCFVDLFAGGCAVTHCAMLSGKYSQFIANDVTDVPQLFVNAIQGKYHDERRWISREDFFRLKDSDPYVRICWSFGNDAQAYLYGDFVEPIKRAMHAICFAETVDARRLALKDLYRAYVAIDEERVQLCRRALEICAECGVEPIYRADGSPDAERIYDAVYKVKSAALRQYLRDALAQSGKTQEDVQKHLGNFMARHYFGESQWSLPTAEQYAKLQEILPALTTPWGELSESLQRLQSLESLESLQRLQRLQSLESLQRLQSLQSLQSLESLQRLQSLQSLQSLQRLESLAVSRMDYRAVPIPAGAVVYADAPYKDTAGYGDEPFDYGAYYAWLRERDYPVYVSEYSMPEDFVEIASVGHVNRCTAKGAKRCVERLFVHERFAGSIISAARTEPTLFD